MIVPMTEEYAVRYLDWSYPEPYEFYNIPRRITMNAWKKSWKTFLTGSQ